MARVSGALRANRSACRSGFGCFAEGLGKGPEAERLFLVITFGKAAGLAGHFANDDPERRGFLRPGRWGVFNLRGNAGIVGNLPLCRPGERLGNLLFIEAQALLSETVEND